MYFKVRLAKICKTNDDSVTLSVVQCNCQERVKTKDLWLPEVTDNFPTDDLRPKRRNPLILNRYIAEKDPEFLCCVKCVCASPLAVCCNWKLILKLIRKFHHRLVAKHRIYKGISNVAVFHRYIILWSWSTLCTLFLWNKELRNKILWIPNNNAIL